MNEIDTPPQKKSNWKHTFINLLCATTSKQEDISKAFSLKYDNRPDSIFKFRKVDKYSLDNLRNDKVWLARPSTLNHLVIHKSGCEQLTTGIPVYIQ